MCAGRRSSSGSDSRSEMPAIPAAIWPGAEDVKPSAEHGPGRMAPGWGVKGLLKGFIRLVSTQPARTVNQ